MRRSLFRYLAVSVLLVGLSMPAQAASRRDDDSQLGLLQKLQKKIVQVVKRIVPLDDFVPTVTKP